MSDDRKDQRVKVQTLKAKYKSATVDEFIDQYAGDVSRGGIFIKTPKPSAVGALLKIEILLKDGAPVLSAVGRVAWRREEATPGNPAGMGIKFIKIESDSLPVIERIVERKLPGEGPHFEDPAEADTAAAPAGPTHSAFFGQTNPEAEMPAEQDRTMMRQMSAFLGEALRGAKEDPRPAEPARRPVPKSTIVGMPQVNPLIARALSEAAKPAAAENIPEPPAAAPVAPEPVAQSFNLEKTPDPAASVEPPEAPRTANLGFDTPTAVSSKAALERALRAAQDAEGFEGEPTHVADRGQLDQLLVTSAQTVEPVADAPVTAPSNVASEVPATPVAEPTVDSTVSALPAEMASEEMAPATASTAEASPTGDESATPETAPTALSAPESEPVPTAAVTATEPPSSTPAHIAEPAAAATPTADAAPQKAPADPEPPRVTPREESPVSAPEPTPPTTAAAHDAAAAAASATRADRTERAGAKPAEPKPAEPSRESSPVSLVLIVLGVLLLAGVAYVMFGANAGPSTNAPSDPATPTTSADPTPPAPTATSADPTPPAPTAPTDAAAPTAPTANPAPTEVPTPTAAAPAPTPTAAPTVPAPAVPAAAPTVPAPAVPAAAPTVSTPAPTPAVARPTTPRTPRPRAPTPSNHAGTVPENPF
jgi:uncharacterized protein (TIGR02266 family)